MHDRGATAGVHVSDARARHQCCGGQQLLHPSGAFHLAGRAGAAAGARHHVAHSEWCVLLGLRCRGCAACLDVRNGPFHHASFPLVQTWLWRGRPLSTTEAPTSLLTAWSFVAWAPWRTCCLAVSEPELPRVTLQCLKCSVVRRVCCLPYGGQCSSGPGPQHSTCVPPH